MQPARGVGKQLRGTLKAYDSDDIAEVMRWFWAGTHDRARFLREKGMGLKTLLRPANFDEYLAFARVGTVAAPGRTGTGYNRAQEQPGRTLDTDADRKRKAELLAQRRAKREATG